MNLLGETYKSVDDTKLYVQHEITNMNILFANLAHLTIKSNTVYYPFSPEMVRDIIDQLERHGWLGFGRKNY